MAAWDGAIARLRAEMLRLVERHVNGLFGWTRVSAASATGDQDQVQTSDEPTQDETGVLRIGTRPARRVEPWGFRGRPPDKVRTLWVRLGSSNVLFIGVAAGKGYGPTDLDVGETALYCSQAGTEIRLDKDGAIDVDAASGQDVTVNGGTAKVGRVGDSVNGGTVTAVAPPGGGAVQFVYTPVGGAAGAASPTLTLTGGQITSGADRFKA